MDVVKSPSAHRILFLGVSLASALVTVSCADIYVRLYPTAAMILVNSSDLAVFEFRVSPTATEPWGENQLLEPLLSDDSVRIDGLPRDVVRVKLVFSSGVQRVLEEIDLTDTEVYELIIVSE